MKCLVDFHIHSTCSDGMNSIKEIIDKLEKNNIFYAAITDHDKVTHVRESTEVQFILGCEFTCTYDGRVVHILGYGNRENSAINLMNTDIRKAKKNAYIKKMYLLQKNNSNIEWNNIENLASIENYIGEYLENKGITAEKVLKCLNEAGWVSILAHPTRSITGIIAIKELISKLKLFGLRGVECFHPCINQELSKVLIEFCRKEKLLISGGSDYHGKENMENGEIGIELESELIYQFLQAL